MRSLRVIEELWQFLNWSISEFWQLIPLDQAFMEYRWSYKQVQTILGQAFEPTSLKKKSGDTRLLTY